MRRRKDYFEISGMRRVSPAAFSSLINTETILPSLGTRPACRGRRIASELGILVPTWLEWFSIPAWGVGDPGFKSQRPHQKPIFRK